MQYFVYIIYSPSKDIYYKGMTSNPDHRLYEHNTGMSRYTKDKGPWDIVYLEKMPDKRTALIRERQIKRFNYKSIQRLLNQDCNLIQK